MKHKRKRVKLSEMLSGLRGRYKWSGTWPAIPTKLRSDELPPRREPIKQRVQRAEAQPDGSIQWRETEIEVPANAPPLWIESIYERLFEKILPPKQRATEALTVEFYDAAIFGYAYAALRRERAARLKACKTLPPESTDRQVHEELVRYYTPTLEAIRRRIDEVLADWDLQEDANYLGGEDAVKDNQLPAKRTDLWREIAELRKRIEQAKTPDPEDMRRLQQLAIQMPGFLSSTSTTASIRIQLIEKISHGSSRALMLAEVDVLTKQLVRHLRRWPVPSPRQGE